MKKFTHISIIICCLSNQKSFQNDNVFIVFIHCEFIDTNYIFEFRVRVVCERERESKGVSHVKWHLILRWHFHDGIKTVSYSFLIHILALIRIDGDCGCRHKRLNIRNTEPNTIHLPNSIFHLSSCDLGKYAFISLFSLLCFALNVVYLLNENIFLTQIQSGIKIFS